MFFNEYDTLFFGVGTYLILGGVITVVIDTIFHAKTGQWIGTEISNTKYFLGLLVWPIMVIWMIHFIYDYFQNHHVEG